MAIDQNPGSRAGRWARVACAAVLATWDYDLPAQPTLAGTPTANGKAPALIQPTKRDDIFVLDRGIDLIREVRPLGL
jgi:glucose dehydrogenase